MNNKNVYIIAGSNGSGKTTFAKTFLPENTKCSKFINADLIASGLSPFSPRAAAMKAGRLLLEEVHKLADADIEFAFETTLSGKSYISFLKSMKEKGWSVHIYFLWIPNPELAIKRIKDRAATGGHDVPGIDVRRRFNRGLYNFFAYYKPLSNGWHLFDNSDIKPRLVAMEKTGRIEIFDKELYEKIIEHSRR